MCESDSFIHRSVFGGGRGSGGISTVGFMPQMVYSKLCTAFDQLITDFFQKFLVTSIIVIFPNMCGEPWTGDRIEVPLHGFTG